VPERAPWSRSTSATYPHRHRAASVAITFAAVAPRRDTCSPDDGAKTVPQRPSAMTIRIGGPSEQYAFRDHSFGFYEINLAVSERLFCGHVLVCRARGPLVPVLHSGTAIGPRYDGSHPVSGRPRGRTVLRLAAARSDFAALTAGQRRRRESTAPTLCDHLDGVGGSSCGTPLANLTPVVPARCARPSMTKSTVNAPKDV
jgi:hypothetical protein